MFSHWILVFLLGSFSSISVEWDLRTISIHHSLRLFYTFVKHLELFKTKSTNVSNKIITHLTINDRSRFDLLRSYSICHTKEYCRCWTYRWTFSSFTITRHCLDFVIAKSFSSSSFLCISYQSGDEFNINTNNSMSDRIKLFSKLSSHLLWLKGVLY